MFHEDLRVVGYTEDPGFMQISGWLVTQEIYVSCRYQGGWFNRRSMFHVDLRVVGNTEDPGFMQIFWWLITQKIQV